MDVALLSELNGAQDAQNHEDRIFSILFEEDELTWQTIIYDLVKTEQMNPWDVNIHVIAEKFLKMLRKMKEMDFRIGGKMILAAALLVKIKSEKLMKEDIVALDNLINSPDNIDLLEELDELGQPLPFGGAKPELVPRTPQPRQRKVSVYDLVEALEKALNVENKKNYRQAVEDAQPVIKRPEKKADMSALINNVFNTIKGKLTPSSIISFDDIIPSSAKEDKVYTFIPLLHLDNQQRIDLMQKEHFGNINIRINKFKLEAAPEEF